MDRRLNFLFAEGIASNSHSCKKSFSSPLSVTVIVIAPGEAFCNFATSLVLGGFADGGAASKCRFARPRGLDLARSARDANGTCGPETCQGWQEQRVGADHHQQIRVQNQRTCRDSNGEKRGSSFGDSEFLTQTTKNARRKQQFYSVPSVNLRVRPCHPVGFQTAQPTVGSGSEMV